MLTNACQYAIRSILYLARYADEMNKIGVNKIADELEIPQHFSAKLLQKLAKSNLISSVKGPNGGFYMNKDNLNNSVWDIINCIDGTDKFDQCFLGLASCDDKNPCPVHYIVAPFKAQLLADFRDKTIAKFTEDIFNSGKIISLKEFNILDQDHK